MQRVLPGARFVEMEPRIPIFHSFFEIDSLEHFPQAYNAGPPIFRGPLRGQRSDASACR